MISKYLTADPVPWLLEESDPCVQYLTKRDILGDNTPADYGILCKSPELMKIMNSAQNGILGDKTNFDIYYTGSMWLFAEAVARGLDRRIESIERTAEFLAGRCQMPSGGFSLNWKPGTEVACRTGDMIRSMILAGYRDERIKKGIDWIISHQRHDGGWLHCPLAGIRDLFCLMLFNRAGKGLSREDDRGVTSCFYATIACANALAEYGRKNDSTVVKGAAGRAAEFFLKRELYKNSEGYPLRPRWEWNRDFRLLGYPVMSQYDILYGLLFIARAGFSSDPRAGNAFNLVMSKQNTDGTWNLENAQTGMLYGNGRPPIGEKNKWVTLNALRLLKMAG